MTCSPCYLANAEDCPRSLACLRFFEPNLVYETADFLLRRVGPVEVARSGGGVWPPVLALPFAEPEPEAAAEADEAVEPRPGRKPKAKRRQREPA
jgi:hypothetical protein